MAAADREICSRWFSKRAMVLWDGYFTDWLAGVKQSHCLIGRKNEQL